MGSIGGKFPRGYLRKLSSDFEDTKHAAITASMTDAQSKRDMLSSSFGTEFQFFDTQLTNVSSSFKTEFGVFDLKITNVSSSFKMSFDGFDTKLTNVSSSFKTEFNDFDTKLTNVSSSFSGSIAEIDNKVEDVSGSVGSGSSGTGATGDGDFDTLTITSPLGQKYQICIDDEGIPSFKKVMNVAYDTSDPCLTGSI
tara:strand:+ start:525 stop:1112 length:588 start_codon:yes stop_codon:yes gene_type:complete